MKHHKRAHNGKDRVTGSVVKTHPKNEGKKQRSRVATSRKPAMMVLSRPRKPCCETPEKRELVNERLLAELSTLTWDKVWNETTGTWDRVIPHHFVARNRAHMAHFRAVAREHFGL